MTLKGVLAFIVVFLTAPVIFVGFITYVSFLAKLMGVTLK